MACGAGCFTDSLSLSVSNASINQLVKRYDMAKNQIDLKGKCMTKLHVQTAGENGPRVIMIQGTGVAGCGWSPQVEALQDRYQLAWFDNRGIGKSPGQADDDRCNGQDVEEVLEHLGWADAHVVGHSLGGVIAQAFAVHAPQRVLSLACLCTFLQGRSAVALDFSRVLDSGADFDWNFRNASHIFPTW